MSQWIYKTGLVYRDYSDYFTHIHQQCVVLCIRNQSRKDKCARSKAAATGATTGTATGGLAHSSSITT